MEYKIELDIEAQAWMDRQSEDVQRYVLSILNRLKFNPIGSRSKQLENPRWFDPQWGWARRIRFEGLPDLRCIYYIWEAKREIVAVKFGTHADDVYEDGN